MVKQRLEPPPGSGFWGKLPGHGDFVGRGLPHDWIRAWDDWLQRGLDRAALTHSPAQLRAALAQMPVWFYVARPLAVSTPPAAALSWCGLLAPSRDRVGRAFPITLTQAWPDLGADDFDAVQAHLDRLLALLPLATTAGAAEPLAAALRAITRPRGGPPAQAPAAWPQSGPGGVSWWWRPAACGDSPAPQRQSWPPGDEWLLHLLERR